jgi:Flp pilus assembly protein TadD
MRQETRGRALAFPLTFTLLLLALSLLPTIRHNSNLLRSFLGAGAVLLAWNVITLVTARRRGRALAVEIVLRPQHYLQACAHLSILAYWGWYWREVYHAAPLIAAQLVFAYAFDALLTWSRRDTYTFGFGPFPIVFSTNLFLLFKPDWFYLQFLMVAVGFAAKELIRWNKDGRQTHIFNPSSFTLTVFSVFLLLTGTTSITWGPEISVTQFNPPHIYLLIFLVSLPAQVLFGTATMTLSAVATTYLFGLLYYAATGTHYWFPGGDFFQEPIPIAVFLGMHLLFTDPSTSPRTELGRIIFGVLYGLSVVGLISLLISLNLPGFYDKLLPVPILNLMILWIDKAVHSGWLKRFDPGTLGRRLMPRQRNLVYVCIWAVTFVTMQGLIGAQTTLIRGDVLMQQGRTEEGISRYREFVRADPSDATGHQKLGTALMQAGRFDEAVPALQRAIDLEVNSPDAYNNLGAAQMQLGRTQDAAASFQRAIEIQRDMPLAHSNLGLALMRAGRAQEAARSFQRAVELQPNSPEAHRNLAVALVGAGRVAEAVRPLRRAVELQPDAADAYNALGEVLIQARQFKDAVPSLQRALELKSDYPEAHYNLANALASLGDRSAAAVHLREALRLRHDWPLAATALASLEATPR